MTTDPLLIPANDHDFYYKVHAMSHSGIGGFERFCRGQSPMGDSKAFKIGRGLHLYLLEPDQFNPNDYNSKERVKIMDMADSVFENCKFDWETGAVFENDHYYTYRGMRWKNKIDIQQSGTIVDFKTTRYDNEVDFLSSIIAYKYYRAAACYLNAPLIRKAGIDKFVIIAVSKAKPFNIFYMRFTRDSQAIQTGMDEIDRVMERIRKHPTYDHYDADQEWFDFCKIKMVA